MGIAFQLQSRNNSQCRSLGKEDSLCTKAPLVNTTLCMYNVTPVIWWNFDHCIAQEGKTWGNTGRLGLLPDAWSGLTDVKCDGVL